MAYFYSEPSHTFDEYLLVPGYSSAECIPANVSLKTPLTKFRKGERAGHQHEHPHGFGTSCSPFPTIRWLWLLPRRAGVSFIYGSQSVEAEAAMVARAKAYKAGFVVSDSNITPDKTLADILELKAKTGHSTVAVTEDGSPNGKLLGIVTGRDYRISRMSPDEKVRNFMTPIEKIISAPKGVTLSECNDIIWDHKLNSLPVLDENGCLQYMVFRKDYANHKENPNELLDKHKRYVVGAGVNTRDYEERIPALVEAGADVLCIDSFGRLQRVAEAHDSNGRAPSTATA